VSTLAEPHAPDADLKRGIARLLPESFGADNPAALRFTPLNGGVSSDIWRVDSPAGTVCAKRALAALRVADRWQAPVRRNAEEVKWLQFAHVVVPGHVPRVIAHDAGLGVALLSWFDPSEWRNWKSALLQGQVRTDVARSVATVIGTVHARSAARPSLKARFRNADLFESLRIDPYFATAAQRCPAAAEALGDVMVKLRGSAVALVHGDVSPKNVLFRSDNAAVLLDAECATWGDPAFDVAFLASHLLLKALHRPQALEAYLDTAVAFLDTYEENAPGLLGTSAATLERLVAALVLARVDGKSPVEYLTPDEVLRARDFAVVHLREPARDIAALLAAWRHIVRAV